MLGLLSGHDSGVTKAINDAGQVVGNCTIVPNEGRRAVLWQAGKVLAVDELLTQSAIQLRKINDINNSGQMVATGLGPGRTHTFLLTPVGQPLGDLDIDCSVGPSDLTMLILEWGESDSRADLDGDGDVGFDDLLILLENWGQ